MNKQSCGASIYWQYLTFIKYIQYKNAKNQPDESAYLCYFVSDVFALYKICLTV